ncbi:sodium-independent sulfate anion transporter-like isoform X1 [Vespa crabro]|uniref:sodium-independent sulfate anion transporter-like isoform X1 n=1 Tax=Vespa crabro TaxID=7445 RepID=UPI001F02FB9B|nr:sodium-independent sulfate anion transporter-like isoform X1 [Vespa crabro]
MSVPRKDSISTVDARRKRKKWNISANPRKYLLVLQWLPKYNQFQAVSDVIAGITIGLTMIPQSIAYAALAGLTAQYGLYSSFLGGFIYLLLGTTKEVSIGPTSLMSLLTMEYTHDMPIDFVILLTFLAGCVELTMGLLNLGFLVDFISIPVTSAFTSAAAIIIIVAQIQGLLGLRYKSYNIVDTINKTFKNIDKVHLPDVALSFSCIVFLLLFRKLQDFGKSKTGNNEITRTKKILWFLSIGRNALVVLITSIISFNLTLQESSPFTLSGKVKPGLPAVSIPPFSSQIGNRTYTFFDMCSHYGSGIFMIPIIAVLTNVAIAKVFASGGSLNAKQEMLTLGICNILGSFFSSMPTCGALTRSAVSAASGIQTPMAGLYTGIRPSYCLFDNYFFNFSHDILFDLIILLFLLGILTLLALSFLTPYFYYIPRATLAAVLVSAVFFMVDLRIFKVLWKGSRKDAIAAIVTFIVCILCNIEVGLLLGAALNIIFLLHPSARPNLSTIECKTDLGNEYLMLKPDTGFYYPAVDFLSNKLETIATKYEEKKMPLLVDCERFQGFDYTAIKSMERLSKQLNSKTQRLWLLNVKPEVIETISILADKKYFLFINDHDKIKSFVDEIKKNSDEENLVNEENGLMKNAEKEHLEMEVYEESNGIFKKRNDDIKESDKMSLHRSNA